MEPSDQGNGPSQRCCLGLLYYSQLMQEQNKKPVCLGLKHTPGQEIEVDDRTQLGEGLTDYKFFCLGHSVYRQPHIAKGAAGAASTSGDGSSSSSDGTEAAVLPYCEGFEVIVAGQLEDAPAHHSGAEGHGQAAGGEGQQQGSLVATLLGGGEESKLGKYLDRFAQVANRNIDRMQSTLTTAYNLTLKPFIDRLSDDS